MDIEASRITTAPVMHRNFKSILSYNGEKIFDRFSLGFELYWTWPPRPPPHRSMLLHIYRTHRHLFEKEKTYEKQTIQHVITSVIHSAP